MAGHLSGRSPAVAGAAFALGAFGASAGWQLTLAAAGTAPGRALAGPRGRLGAALASSLITAGLAIHLLAG